MQAKGTGAKPDRVTACSNHRPSKPRKEWRLRLPKVQPPIPRISRSSADARKGFQTRIYRVLDIAILRAQTG
jgi:hypothetical protein